MKIEQLNQEKKGSFVMMDQEVKAGLMTYVWVETSKIIIDHTEVSKAYSGQGIGKKLVMAAVVFARKESIKILPLCPFAKSVFDKTPEIADVLF